MKLVCNKSSLSAPLLLLLLISAVGNAQEIVHDAEYYILEAQNGGIVGKLKTRHWMPSWPNCGRSTAGRQTSFTSCGTTRPMVMSAFRQSRRFVGSKTPNLNQMAREGILFTRMYTEVGCTPSRAACMTGRHPVRNAMYNIGMLREMHGLRASETTLAEVAGQRRIRDSLSR